ncbi:hypothetical protein [Actinomyces trachealis]|uniref:hypothetical protein n=1 Tax=Actinomyces trachealis TaxID=2763540 RepID=UPI0018929655|nr:hypothetical protein [Actinomyces trachealis]
MSTRTRSLADIRVIVSAVLGIIGLFLLVCSAFLNGEEEMAKTGGVNANLWAGLALVAVAAVMSAWWFLNPAGEPGDENVTGMPESEIETPFKH